MYNEVPAASQKYNRWEEEGDETTSVAGERREMAVIRSFTSLLIVNMRFTFESQRAKQMMWVFKNPAEHRGRALTQQECVKRAFKSRGLSSH